MPSPSQSVLASVARAARLRRARSASRVIWRAAPLGAAVCAALGAGVRWAGWSPMWPVLTGAAALMALAAYATLARRDRDVSDLAAADIDGRAGLGGELRSASWFAARGTRDDWVDFHLSRAAERLAAIDWTGLYPPMRARREKAATAVLAIAAIVLVLPAAGRSGIHALGSPAKAAAVAAPAPVTLVLPDDVRKQLEDLLKRAEASSLTSAGRPLTEAEVRDLLARLAQSPDLKNAKDSDHDRDAGKPLDPSAAELKALAERAERASEMATLSPEVRDALADLADKLSEKSGTSPSSPKDPQDTQGAADAQKGDAAQSSKAGEKQDASIQAVKEAGAGGGVGVVMMSSDDPKGAQEAGLGLGGASADRNGGGRMPDIPAGLRKETIEAYKDDTGEKSEDLRRKTDQGTATVGYAASSPAALEKGRATAPPAVPESRRAAVQTYFIRKQ